jgi:hypothetical protein
MTPDAASADRTGRFRRRTRNAVLTAHIIVSVGLLGDSAGFLAVAVRRATSDDPVFVEAAHDLLNTLALGLGTPWGVLRHPWVVAKLILIVTVIAVGALVLRPVLDDDAATANSTPLVAAASYDVAALSVATALAVFKPGRARRRTSTSPAPATAGADAGHP